jgi:acyl carrier protein
MTQRDTLTREVIEIVAEVAELEPGEVDPAAKLEDLDIDSLDGLRIVAAVEKKYGIVIDEAEIAEIRTMPDIIALVDRHAAEVE